MANDSTQMFDKDGVVAAMNTIGDLFQGISTTYSTADSQMATELTTPDGAMYGEGATKILSAWDENSGTLEDFMATFSNWSALVSGMAGQFTNLEEGTYEINQDVDIDEIAEKARSFHTTALKTAKGMESYNKAQADFYANHPELLSYDENGLAYSSFKTVENGKIVETKVYTDANGDVVMAEETHWDPDSGTYVTKYYEGGEIKDIGNNHFSYDNSSAKELDKDEYADKYFGDNEDKIAENWRNKYGAEYLNNGELSKEAQEALDRLPQGTRDNIISNLDDIKNNIIETNGVRNYDDKGNLESITYKGTDGHDYTIKYEYDANGNITGVKYYRDTSELDKNDITTMNNFYNNISGAPDTGAGSSGGQTTTPTPAPPSIVNDPSNQTSTYTAIDEDGNETNYVISNQNGQAQISINGQTYNIFYDNDGNRYYKDLDGNKIGGDQAQELDNIINQMAAGDKYAAGLAGATVGGQTYSIDSNGNVVGTMSINGVPGAPDGEVKITYGEDGNPTKYTYTDPTTGQTIDLPPDAVDGWLNGHNQPGTDGTVTSFSIDTDTGTIVKTTTKDNIILKEEKIDTLNNTREIMENTVDESGNITEVTTIKLDGNQKETYRKTETYSFDEDGNQQGRITTETGEPDKYEYKGENGKYVEVTSDQYKNLEAGGGVIPGENKYKEYSIHNGRYTETIHEGNDETGRVLEQTRYSNDTGEEQTFIFGNEKNPKKPTQRITKKGDDYTKTEDLTYDENGTYTGKTTTVEDGNHVYAETVDKDNKFISGTYDGVEVNKDEYKNLTTNNGIKEENGKTIAYTIEEGKYTVTTSKNDILVSKQVTTKDSDGRVTSLLETTYDSTGKVPRKTEEIKYNENDIMTSRVTTTFDSNGTTPKSSTEVLYKEDGKSSKHTITTTYGSDGKAETIKVGTSGTIGSVEVNEAQAAKIRIGKDKGVEYTIEDGKFTQITYDKTHADKPHEKITQNVEGNTITKSTYTYDKDGNTTEVKEEGEISFNIGKIPVTRTGEKTITYDSTTGKPVTMIAKTEDEKGNKNTFEDEYTGDIVTHHTLRNNEGHIVDESKYDNSGQQTYHYTIEGTTEYVYNFEAGKVKDQTITEANGDYVKTVYSKPGDNSTGQIKARQITTNDGIVLSYDEKSEDVKCSGIGYTDYSFTKATVEEIAKTGKAPSYIPQTNANTKQNYTDFLNNCKDGDIIMFGEGQHFQYDNSADSRGDAVAITTEKGSAFVVDNGKLVNINNPDEYYYIDVLNNSSSRAEYGKKEGNITYEQLQIMRDNYGGEGKDDYSEASIAKWTVYEALGNHSEPIEIKPEWGIDVNNATDVDRSANVVVTYDGDIVTNDCLRSEGYIDNMLKSPEKITYNLTNGVDTDTYTYDANFGLYICRDQATGKYTIFDPATRKVYKV